MKNKISDLLFLMWPCCFILGIFAFPILSLYLFFLFLAISIFLFLTFIRLSSPVWRLSLGAIFFCIGSISAHFSQYNLPQMIDDSDSYVFQFMQVMHIEPKDKNNMRYLLKVGDNQFIQVTSSYNQPRIKHCDLIHGRVYLNRASQKLTPTGFNLYKYAQYKKIIAYGWSLEQFKHTQIQAKNLACQTNYLRRNIYKMLEKRLSHQSLALSSALLIGYKAQLSDEIKNNFKSLGISHTLVISGLHVGLISLFFFNLFRFIFALIPFLYRYYNIKSFAAFLTVIIVIFYCLIAGYQAATLRATIMVIYGLMAIISNRIIFSFRTFSLPLMTILLIDPNQIYMAGFQLSFLAVFGIILYNKTQMFKRKILQNIFMTSFIILWLAPITFYYFGFSSLVGLLTNILILPLLTFIILPLLFLGFIIPPLWEVNGYLLHKFLKFIEGLDLKEFIYATVQPDLLWIFSFYIIVSLLLIYRIYFEKFKYFTFLFFMMTYMAFIIHLQKQEQKISQTILIYEGPSIAWRVNDKLYIHYFKQKHISDYKLLQIKQYFGVSPYESPFISYGSQIKIKNILWAATKNYTYLKALCLKADIVISPYEFRCKKTKAIHLKEAFSSYYYQIEHIHDINKLIIKYFND